MEIFLYNPNSENKYFFLYIEEKFSPFLHARYLSFVPVNTLSTTPLSALGEHLCMIKSPLPTGFLMGLVNDKHWHEIRRKKESEVTVFMPQAGWSFNQKSQLLSGRPHHQPLCLWFSSTVLFPMSLLAWVIIWAPHAVPSFHPLLPGMVTAVTNIVFCSALAVFPHSAHNKYSLY